MPMKDSTPMPDSPRPLPTRSRVRRPLQFGLRAMLLVLTLLAVLLGLIVQPLREAARRDRCSRNLAQIGVALHNYHDTWRSFPPAVTLGPDGRPWHGWRVLILPHLGPEARNLSKAYRLDEPWDGPNNRKLHAASVECGVCPDDQRTPLTGTSYLAVVGPHTVWPGVKATRFRDCIDGTSNTIAVVEVLDSGIHWMEPRDLSIDDFASTPGTLGPMASKHRRGVNVLTLDGARHTLTADLDHTLLMRLLRRDDGEVVDWNEIEP